MQRPGSKWLLAASLALAALMTLAAVGGNLHGAPSRPTEEFHFVRMYCDNDHGGFGRRGRGTWTTDCPAAEDHFATGVGRLTRVELGPPRTLEVTDDPIFDYPWLHAVEVGRWYPSDHEAARLGEYLLRGAS